MVERMRNTQSIIRRVGVGIVRKTVGTVTHFAVNDPIVALTFDDGPHSESTPRLLDILRRYEASATFFLVGRRAKAHSNLVAQIAREGHTVANHSWDHQSLVLLSGRQRREAVRRCQTAIAPYHTRFFRPPYGHLDFESSLDLFLMGFKVVGWSLAAEDWRERDAEWMFEKLARDVRPGRIILLHDFLYEALDPRFCDRENSFAALDRFLSEFRLRFRFVTLPEIWRRGRPIRRLCYRSADADWLMRLRRMDSESFENDMTTGDDG